MNILKILEISHFSLGYRTFPVVSVVLSDMIGEHKQMWQISNKFLNQFFFFFLCCQSLCQDSENGGNSAPFIGLAIQQVTDICPFLLYQTLSQELIIQL